MNQLNDRRRQLQSRLNAVRVRLRALQAEADLAEAETRLRYRPDLSELAARQAGIEAELREMR